MSSVLVIEPHPDDAMLNMWGMMQHLTVGQNMVRQVTICAQKEDPRDNLYETYFRTLFAQQSMECSGIDWTLKGRKKYAEEWGADWNTPDTLREIFKTQNDGRSIRSVMEEVLASTEWESVIVPIGQIHPMHIIVREEVEAIIGRDILLYKEFPYHTRSRKPTFDGVVEEMGLVLVNEIVLTDEELEQKCADIKLHYPLGYLYMVQFPHAQEVLRLEEVYAYA